MGIVGLGILLAGSIAIGSGLTAQAVTGGTDWGHVGWTSETPSTVTVRWDNVGNTPEQSVPRDATQVLPHTNGRTYMDIDERARSAYQSRFGSDNGLGGAQMTVSQTTDLVNQSISVKITGAQRVAPANDPNSTSFRLMQCWGAPGPDGKPDPAATSPDPLSCQSGNGVSDAADNATLKDGRRVEYGADWMKEGDLANAFSVGQDLPFQSIDGKRDTSLDSQFTVVTTNEIGTFRVGEDGTGERLFEVQTGSEAPGLGCGYRPDAPSMSTCWLVAVPKVGTAGGKYTTGSPLSPANWAERLQVKLGFRDIDTGCPGGQARTLTAGSELLSGALASWAPALCEQKNISVGFTPLGDEQARQQLAAGGQSLAFTSKAAASDATHIPVAMAGVVIGYRAFNSFNGPMPVTDLKLNARLVAKLLTQSYRGQIDDAYGTQIAAKAPWTSGLVYAQVEDPEYQKLNPDFAQSGARPGELIASITRSDAALQVWQWILNDKSARSFLNGCPDPYGAVINPFYSTRSYAECPEQAVALEKTAAAQRASTKTPSVFSDAPMSYPPTGSAFPLSNYYERDAVTEGTEQRSALTFTSMHPRENTLSVIGRDVGRGLTPQNTRWCSFDIDSSCVGAVGEKGAWKSSAVPVGWGPDGTTMGITDSVSAAKYQLQTALLCDETGEHCVGADTDSLRKAAAGFDKGSVAGIQQPSVTPDYAAGEYPMTMPVYAAVNTKKLTAAQAGTIADVLDYATGTGQQPGVVSGSLPNGYAPLTTTMLSQASVGIAALRAVTDAVVPAAAPAAVPAAAPAPARAPQAASVPVTRPAPAAVAQPASTPAAPAAIPAAQVGTTAAAEIGFPQFGLIAGLVAAVVAGLASPVIGRRRKAGAR